MLTETWSYGLPAVSADGASSGVPSAASEVPDGAPRSRTGRRPHDRARAYLAALGVRPAERHALASRRWSARRGCAVGRGRATRVGATLRAPRAARGERASAPGPRRVRRRTTTSSPGVSSARSAARQTEARRTSAVQRRRRLVDAGASTGARWCSERDRARASSAALGAAAPLGRARSRRSTASPLRQLRRALPWTRVAHRRRALLCVARPDPDRRSRAASW